VIALESVWKRFSPSAPPVVEAVDVAVGDGEWLALIGESGSGKTTLLRMINRMVTPTSGRVVVAGRDVATVPAEELRRGIGYVLQGIGLFPHWTVAENAGAVPRLLGWPEERIRARVDHLLETVGLPSGTYRDRLPDELSGGQRQRVGVARALAAEPRILLMDEPFGALDPVTRHSLQTEVRALHQQLGLTTVMVTHDMAEALLLADRIAVMRSGRLLRLGAPRELLRDPGDPYVAALLEAPRRHAALLEKLGVEP
jgi:osmoprotectant transport system ATP-binding protein